MKIDGQCHCGHVAYEAEIDPENIWICHCTDCQQFSGSPYRVSVITGRDTIRMTGHEPKVYRKTSDSGRIRLQLFCPECGSALFATGEGPAAERWGIRWGSIRQRESLVPKWQIWHRSAVAWAEDISALPKSSREKSDAAERSPD